MSSYIITLTDEDEFVDKIESEMDRKAVAVVDFWAPWCGPCKTMEPILDEAAQEMVKQDLGLCYKVNVDENRDLAARFEIRSIPTLIFFKGGKKAAQLSGVLDKESILQKVRDL